MSAPSSESGAPESGLKKDVRLENFSVEEAGSVECWLKDANFCFKLFKIASDMLVPEAVAALTGPAAAWSRKFCPENGAPIWELFSNKIQAQFMSKFAEVAIAQELNSLTHSGSIKEYVEAHMKICQRAPSNSDVKSAMMRHIFKCNMSPYLYKLMDIIQCKSLADTYVEGRNTEDKANFSGRQNQSGDKGQNCQKRRWGESNKRSGFRQDQNKDTDKPKFPPKKFAGQKPQQTSQMFNAEKAEDSSDSVKDPGVQ